MQLAALFGRPRRGFVHVAMGTLVHDPTVRATVHMFVGSKVAWTRFTDGLPQFEEYAAT